MKGALLLFVGLLAGFLAFPAARSAHRTISYSPPDPAAPVAREAWRHMAFLERAAKGDIDTVLLGDSLTDGWGDHPDLWAEYLGPRAAKFGVNGDQVGHVLWRVRNGELDGYRAKAVVLLIGTNNLSDSEPDAVADAIGLLLGDIRQRQPHAHVLLVALPPREGIDKVDRLNARLRAMAAGDRVAWVDPGFTRAMLSDGVHLCADGYRAWGEALRPLLD